MDGSETFGSGNLNVSLRTTCKRSTPWSFVLWKESHGTRGVDNSPLVILDGTWRQDS